MPTIVAEVIPKVFCVCVIVRDYEEALTLFINRKAREKFDILMDSIDAAPVIPPCQTSDPDLWFSDFEEKSKYRVAKEFCNRCPVRRQCLEYALANEEQFGMFGGKTPRERRELLKTRKSPA